MKEKLRIVLVDPRARTRQEFQRQLVCMNEVDLVEVISAYPGAGGRIAALVPDLVIVVVDDNLEQAAHLVEITVSGQPGVMVLPAGSENEARVILRLVRSGAREFLPLPASPLELGDAFRRLCPSLDQGGDCPRGPQVIAVTGATGGVGCTSLAVNLATTLSKRSRRPTVLADFDLLFGSLEESLAVIPDNSLEIVARNIDDFDPSLLKRWLFRHGSGLYVLPHPVSMEDAARIEPDSIRQVMALLKASFDTIVVDTSKSLQAVDFLAFEQADVILVVFQLNLNCTRNSVRLLHYFDMFEGFAEKVRLVVNRCDSRLSEISLKKAEEHFRTRIKWLIPNATKFFRPARMQGVPIDELEGGARSKAHKAIVAMAQELLPFPLEPPRTRRGLFGALR